MAARNPRAEAPAGTAGRFPGAAVLLLTADFHLPKTLTCLNRSRPCSPCGGRWDIPARGAESCRARHSSPFHSEDSSSHYRRVFPPCSRSHGRVFLPCSRSHGPVFPPYSRSHGPVFPLCSRSRPFCRNPFCQASSCRSPCRGSLRPCHHIHTRCHSLPDSSRSYFPIRHSSSATAAKLYNSLITP